MSNGAPSSLPPAPDPARTIWRFVMTQNPFYLLSVCFVLHGTAFWFQQQGGEFSPWPLMGLICGYVALMAATGVLLVRWGRVWDDARSILAVILLLLTELALTFDDVLIRQPKTGTALLLIGCGFSMLTCEAVLRLIGIRLRWGFRGPLHAMLALLFLYPLWVLEGAQTNSALVVGRVYGFHLALAGVWLLLWRAVRGGSAYIAGHGTPWKWPVFPWAIFAFLGVGLALRGFSLGSAFDPATSLSTADAMTLQSAYAPYFLAPTVLAIAMLVLEAGRLSGNLITRGVGLCLPVLAIGLSCLPQQLNVPQQLFLQQFEAAAGSPLWIACVAVVGVYALALARGMTAAATPLWLTLLALVFVGPATHNPGELVLPQLVPAALAAVAAAGLAIGFRDSRWWMAAAVPLALCLAALPLPLELRVQASVAGLAVLLTLIVLTGRDAWTRQLGFLLLQVYFVASLALALQLDRGDWQLSALQRTAGLLGLPLLSGLIALRLWTAPAGWFAGIVGGIGCLRGGYDLTELIRLTTGWAGVQSFAIGLLLFGAGLAISIRKARRQAGEVRGPGDFVSPTG